MCFVAISIYSEGMIVRMVMLLLHILEAPATNVEVFCLLKEWHC